MTEGDEVPPAQTGEQIAAHATAAWRAWLSALAVDAEAALAAAMTYASLEPAGRNAWIEALDADSLALDTPRVALYAPLLAVENDPDRRARIEAAMGRPSLRIKTTKALCGTTSSGDAIGVIVMPMYLEFVELLVCRYRAGDGVLAAQHDPLRHVTQIDAGVAAIAGEKVALVPVPLRVVIEDLAHEILADRRSGRSSPAILAAFAHLFALDLQDEADDGDGDHAPS